MKPSPSLIAASQQAEQALTGTSLTSVTGEYCELAADGHEDGAADSTGTEAADLPAPGLSPVALALEELTVRFTGGKGPTTAVIGMDLQVRAGETVAIVGESGSGKSTTAAVAAGLLTAGAEVSVAGHRVFGTQMRGASQRAWHDVRGTRIGYVPQDTGSGLNPVRTIGSQLREVLKVHGFTPDEAATRLREVLSEVGLDPDTHPGRYPHEFSGGQRQRVLIALAIAGDPGLIIADEPTSALDVTVQQQVLDLLETLVEERSAALVLITHDLGIARDRADRVLVMEAGRLVESGPAAEILDHPRHDYTRKLIAAAPGLADVPLQSGRRTSGGAATSSDRAAAPPAVQVTGLRRVFGSGPRAVTAVDGVDIHVPAGRTLGIVGESGSGKSTAARMLLGLESADAGSGTVLGEDLSRLPRRVRELSRRARFVHQDATASLDPLFTVGQSISEPLRGFRLGGRAARATRVQELLDLVALPAEIAARRPRELSGGQRQRVALARALASEPEMLVLDEPVSALDVSVQKQILDLLLDIQERLDLSYVFISHDLAVVRHIADEVVVMAGGRIIESGPAVQVFDRPRTELTRRLVAAVPGTRGPAPATASPTVFHPIGA